jgi:GntP family gluconate:H+ symporter
MDGYITLLVFLAGIAGIVALTVRFKAHPFLAMFFTAVAMGVAYGIPGERLSELVVQGFSDVLGYIAVIIVSATVMGKVMEETGATYVVSRTVLGWVGRSRSPVAAGVAGYILALPVMCCDTAFIMLSPLARALSAGSGYSLQLFTLALAAGTFTSFKLVFPAAPLFPATMFGAEASKVIVLGVAASVPALIAGLLLAYRLGGSPLNEDIRDSSDYDRLGESYERLPSPVLSFAVILVPIALIVAGSLFTGVGVLRLVGSPVIALPVGVLVSLLLALGRDPATVNGWISQGVSRSAGILVIVGAGGVLGTILQEAGVGELLGGMTADLGLPGLLVIFLIAAMIKTGQGSSMVTMVTAPAIVLPILPSLGVEPAVAAMAVCAGAMVCVNVNDSFFWVVTGFGEMGVAEGYRTVTLMSVILGVLALAVIAVVGPLIV